MSDQTQLENAKPNRRQRLKVDPQQFWLRVQKPVGCWLYDGCKEINGYGYLKNPLGDEPKFITAHRLAWILTNGPVPEGMVVMHKCDIRACVNPDHLKLGTDADNHADMRDKHRYRGRGEENFNSKLTEDDVRAIRRDWRKTGPFRGRGSTTNGPELAVKYGVHESAIQNIVYGRTWKHLK